MDLLIVDDSAAMRAWLRRVISVAGLPVTAIRESANGFEALLAMRERVPEFVFLDINMPVMNGLQLLAAMRGVPALARLPVLVVSTEGSEARLAEIRAAGAGFIRKPFTPEHLVGAFSALVGDLHGQSQPSPAAAHGPDF